MWVKLLGVPSKSDTREVYGVLNASRRFTLGFFKVFPKEIRSEVKECLRPLVDMLESYSETDSESETHEGDGRISEEPFDVDVLSLFPPLSDVSNPYVLEEQQIIDPNISLDPFGGQGSSQTTTTTDPTSPTDPDPESWRDLFE